MLIAIIYRNHTCDNILFKSIEAMIVKVDERNGQADIAGILLSNRTYFFQLIEGPEERIRDIH